MTYPQEVSRVHQLSARRHFMPLDLWPNYWPWPNCEFIFHLSLPPRRANITSSRTCTY